MDEFIVPYQHHNLTQLLGKLDTEKAASFTMQNAFFYLYWENATEVDTLVEAAGLRTSPGYLRTLYKTRRLTKLLRHGVRSKYIVKPESVVEVKKNFLQMKRKNIAENPSNNHSQATTICGNHNNQNNNI